jgi:ribose transport system ATP-binding protein
MTSQTAIAARGISKTFGTFVGLRDVDFDLRTGEVHALIGGNGSGKSTLIQLLAGVHRPDPGGTLEVFGQRRRWTTWDATAARAVGFRFVHQDLGLFPSLSLAENLWADTPMARTPLSRIRWKQMRKHGQDLLRRYGLDHDPASTLASLRPSDRTMVAILRALRDMTSMGSAAALFLDEPTASLANSEADRLTSAIRRLADVGHSVVYVSHRLDEVMAISDRVSVLRDGRHVLTVPTTEVDENRIIELITGKALPPGRRLHGATTSGKPVLEVAQLSTARLHNVGFTLHAGEIVGVAGLLGSGHKELLRSLFGLRAHQGGTVTLDGRRITLRSPSSAIGQGLAYSPEDRAADAAFGSLSVDDNLAAAVVNEYWQKGHLRHGLRRLDSRRLMASFAVRARSIEQPLLTLSGGNQQKVVLARWIRRRPRVLLLDEPTQGVDVESRAEIYDLVRRATAEGAAALVVASDLRELAEVADRVLVMHNGRIVDELRRPDVGADSISRALFRTGAITV